MISPIDYSWLSLDEETETTFLLEHFMKNAHMHLMERHLVPSCEWFKNDPMTVKHLPTSYVKLIEISSIPGTLKEYSYTKVLNEMLVTTKFDE